MHKIVGFGFAAATVAVVLVLGAQLFGSRSNVGFGGDPTPASASAPPGFSRFTSTMHGISIDVPSGWQIRPATEAWAGGALNHDSPAADVISDPEGDLYVILSSRSGRPNPYDEQSDQWDLIRESGVCNPQGGFGGGSFAVDGASAWGQTCDSGISAANSVEAVAVTTDVRRYLIALVGAANEPAPGQAFDFHAALETVVLLPDEAR